MEWIVKIEKTPDVEDEIQQRIRVVFQPTLDSIFFYGEAKVKHNKWSVFSYARHEIVVTLEQLQECMETVVIDMRKRLTEYENLDKGFSVLKWVAFEEDDSIDEDSQPV